MGRISNSQQRLLRAASDLLWEKSYHSVTLDDVCARAGVLRGSLYYFFDSKSALALAALQHLWQTVAQPAYEEHFSRANPPLLRITEFLSWLQGFQREKFRNVGRALGWPFQRANKQGSTQVPMKPPLTSKVRLFLGATALLCSLDCRQNHQAKSPPAPLVEVATVTQADVPVYYEAIGVLDGLVNAQIRAQPSPTS